MVCGRELDGFEEHMQCPGSKPGLNNVDRDAEGSAQVWRQFVMGVQLTKAQGKGINALMSSLPTPDGEQVRKCFQKALLALREGELRAGVRKP